MDKSRFLDSIPLTFSLFLFLIIFTFLWWFYLYSPMLEQERVYTSGYKQALQEVNQEAFLNNQLLSKKRELLILEQKKNRMGNNNYFSSVEYSKELLNIVAQSGASISFFRVSNWQEKEEKKSCDIEILLQGSVQEVICFLHNVNIRNAKINALAIKKNDNKVTLNAKIKIYMSDENNDPISFLAVEDCKIKNPFFRETIQKISEKKNLKEKLAKLEKFPSKKLVAESLPKKILSKKRKKNSSKSRDVQFQIIAV